MTQIARETRFGSETASSGGGMNDHVGYALKRAYIRVHGAAQSALAEHDLRVLSFSALSMIMDNPDILASELADLLQMERSNLVALIDELERRGLITRTRLSTDRRRYALNSTAGGATLRDAAASDVEKAEAEVLRALTPDEFRTFMDLLRKIEQGRGVAT